MKDYYEERSFRYWSANAMIARAGGRFDLAVLWEEHAQHGVACHYFGAFGSGLNSATATVDAIDWDVALEAIEMAHTGSGLSNNESPHADLGGAS